MTVVRYRSTSAHEVRVGIRGDDGSVHRLPFSSVGELLSLTLSELRQALDEGARGAADPDFDGLLAPVDGLTEVWACGVTYQRSREARMEESAASDVYSRVYEAVRPELFFKSVAWRVVPDGGLIGIRPDSELNVPEPELALVLNSAGELVGLTVCNDVSSRSIEGENPLYLPQAKIYAGSCALGPGFRPIWEVDRPDALTIEVEVSRGGTVVWAGATSTSHMHRTYDQLIDSLVRAYAFPEGAVLATGTGLVPDMDFSLQASDRVTVRIPQVGTLVNLVADSSTIGV